MSLKDFLEERGVKTALIVDDAFDNIPKASDIINADAVWPIFNDDLSDEQRSRIAEVYPLAAERDFDELFRTDGYVAAVWGLREELGEIATTVFLDYVSAQSTDEKYIQLVQQRLEAIGLVCETSGRAFEAKARTVDVIVIDLYLGQGQDPAAFDVSKDALKRAVQAREVGPPLVILMSRSHRLEAKRDEFRDEVGLLDSAFRIIRKADLEEEGVIELQLQRLVDNLEDTRRLSNFVQALNKGLDAAAQRTLALLRKLKLSDLGQIHDLLLDAEGEPTGSYLVDVFDRVLQHEIERDEGIIDAAKALNSFTAVNHPPPFLSGSPELQELVDRLVSQNKLRLKLPGSLESAVTFGDLLRLPLEEQPGHPKLLSDLTQDEVLLVLTPVCDLQRGAAPRVFLLVGEVRDLTAANWSYGADARTPAIRLDDDLRWIQWDLKHVATATGALIDNHLRSGALRLAGRLRESHALELQQRVLSGLGRVGQVALLPATFPVELEVFYASTDNKPSLLEVPELKDAAVCWVGRDRAGKQVIRLMTTEMVGDGVVRALKGLRKEQIAEKAHLAFEHVTTTPDLGRRLAAGLDLKGVSETKWSPITSETGGNKVPAMGLLAWNMSPADGELARADLTRAGVILLIRDRKAIGAPGLEDALRSGAMTSVEPMAGAAEAINPIAEHSVPVTSPAVALADVGVGQE